jgi:hypothetical protein
MITILIIGIFFIALSGIVNLMEIKKFLKALNILNKYTITTKDKILYLPRLISLLPLLAPVIPDLIFISLGGVIGLGGGLLGGIISMGGTCLLTLSIKLFMHLNKQNQSHHISYQDAIKSI